ncbi:hypothetical protein NIES3585_07970 [Nodularia sp. NIES-3585]|nr:hypothetical protein NIES3585_07970 [Nodularia sp. NIES-3585]
MIITIVYGTNLVFDQICGVDERLTFNPDIFLDYQFFVTYVIIFSLGNYLMSVFSAHDQYFLNLLLDLDPVYWFFRCTLDIQ